MSWTILRDGMNTIAWQFKVEPYLAEPVQVNDCGVFYNRAGEVAVGADGKVVHAVRAILPELDGALQNVYLGRWNNAPCFAMQLHEPAQLPEPCHWCGMREAIAEQNQENICVISMGIQLLQWRASLKFCAACATPLVPQCGERAMRCPACAQLYYPRINPAVITAVFHEGKILLARNRNFGGTMFSLIAGYVEAGENLEQGAVRELEEEVGIRVCNLRYWGSQTWPFHAALMFGFTADYAGGEIRPDGIEIVEAGWFSPDRMPELPRQGSIARRMVDEYLARAAGRSE